MSDKDYTGKKGGDDYKPLKFYQERISGVENGFDTFSDGDVHYFTYNIDGQVVLISECYSSVKGRDNGIKSVDKNRLIEARYKQDSLSSGKHFFNIVAGNHQEIATSAWFDNEAAMKAAIARLMGTGSEPLSAISGLDMQATATAAKVVEHASAEPVAAEPIAPAQVAMAAPSAPTSTASSYSASMVVEQEPSKPSVWWWLLPVICFLLLWFLFSQCCQKPKETTIVTSAATTETTVSSAESEATRAATTTGEAVSGAVRSAADTVQDLTQEAGESVAATAADLGRFLANQLPSGVELNIPERGVENKLIAFINDDNRPVDKTTWFNFDRINFATGSAELSDSSKEQIENIAAILDAYPDVELKIGGYTDNTGSLEVNQRLSQERAASVMNALIAGGVALNRLEAEGYGPKHPVATNDTPEGRAQNRRIALRVTQK